MWTSIECAGHPRDMGLAQGGAFADSIRGVCAAAGLPVVRSRLPTLKALTEGSLRGGGAGREMLRHFAHQFERLEGLARGAMVPTDSLLELHLRIRAGGESGGLLSRRASLRAYSGHVAKAAGKPEKQVLLERTLPAALAGEVGWALRESRPAVGFRSIEIGLPWLVPGVAGINEAGLAVMAGPILWGRPGHAGWPPSALLVQESLQRFEDLPGALDWCRKRPVEGDQSIVLADASGSVATVISSGRERRVQEGEGELYLEAGEPPDASASNTGSEDNGEAQIILDPQNRTLRLDAPGAMIEIKID